MSRPDHRPESAPSGPAHSLSAPAPSAAPLPPLGCASPGGRPLLRTTSLLEMLRRYWTQAEIAGVLAVSDRQVRRLWRRACLRLDELLAGDWPAG